MKRFTDTEKWNDEWFRKLPVKIKCLWHYVCDICDASGVFRMDFELASFRIGEPIVASDLEVFGHRLQELPNGKFLIKKFIPFQYGQVRPECRGHRTVIECITRNGLIECFDSENTKYPIGYTYPKPRDTHRDTSILATIPNPVRQDSTGSVLSSSVQGGMGGKIAEMQNILRESYRRSKNEPFSYFENFTIIEILNNRPEAMAELREILAYRTTCDPQYFPKSVTGLLEAWTKTLDRARQPKGRTGKSHNNGFNAAAIPDAPTMAEIQARRNRELEDFHKPQAKP